MNIVDELLRTYFDWVFEWDTYFWSILPFAFFYIGWCRAASEDKSIDVEDLARAILFGVLNPMWYLALVCIPPLAVILFVMIFCWDIWPKIKDKKIRLSFRKKNR